MSAFEAWSQAANWPQVRGCLRFAVCPVNWVLRVALWKLPTRASLAKGILLREDRVELSRRQERAHHAAESTGMGATMSARTVLQRSVTANFRLVCPRLMRFHARVGHALSRATCVAPRRFRVHSLAASRPCANRSPCTSTGREELPARPLKSLWFQGMPPHWRWWLKPFWRPATRLIPNRLAILQRRGPCSATAFAAYLHPWTHKGSK